MVNYSSLNYRHSIIAAVLAGFGILLSFPIFDYWYFVFLSYAIFSFVYLNLGVKKSVGALKVFFVFSLLFWLFRRLILFESIFSTSSNYFQNKIHGVFFTLLLFSLLAIYSAAIGTISLLAVQFAQNKYLKYALIVLSLIVTTELNDIYLPLPAEYVLFQNSYLLASLNFFHPYYYKIGFYILCVLMALNIQSIKKSIAVLVGILGWLLLSGYVGKVAGNSGQDVARHQLNAILVQSNQSVMHEQKKSIEDYFQLVNNEIEKKFKLQNEVYIFWPESFMEQTKENMLKLQEYQKKTNVKQIHLMGTYHFTETGIINKMILVAPEGNIHSEYFKNHLFPIGEKNISIPLMPSSWTKANIPVISSNEVKSLSYGGNTFLPLICYESVIDTHYVKINQLKNSEHRNFMVNISKDSFYEKTSLIKLHSLYSRIKSSIFKIPMIRTSTTEGAEIINANGSILVRSRPNTLSVTSYILR